MEPKVTTKKSFQVIGYQFDANLREIEEGRLRFPKLICKDACLITLYIVSSYIGKSYILI